METGTVPTAFGSQGNEPSGLARTEGPYARGIDSFGRAELIHGDRGVCREPRPHCLGGIAPLPQEHPA